MSKQVKSLITKCSNRSSFSTSFENRQAMRSPVRNMSLLSLAAMVAGMLVCTDAATANVVLSSEDAEGETATYFLQTTANGVSTNVDYQLPGTFQHNNTWLQANTASLNGSGAGSDPSGQHILTRSTTGNMVLRTAGAGPVAPLALASGGYASVTIDFAVNIRYSVDSTALFLDYSALGDFTDSQTVLTLGSIANSGGAAPPLANMLSYEEDRWYAGQSVTLDPGTYSFTDTANIRWRSGGFANSTQILLDDIVITGILPVPEPSSLAIATIGLIGLCTTRRRRRR